ncbi:hypothetical protein [Thermococcus sp.]|uniref:hypothetical protein n=1 Tax=Thermococcus sp. TaxID=35749 RepID=UPI00263416C5|nr:hypothetical protein [Thermococcus sp.]
MKARKPVGLRESRLVDYLSRGFDGRKYFELMEVLERLKKVAGRKGFLLLLLEIPLLSAQEEIGLLLQLLGDVV